MISSKKKPPLKPDDLSELDRRDRLRYAELQRALAHVGFFRRGTLLERHMACAAPSCRCHADPPQLHGPYWQWTRKLRGKTVGNYLSAEQARLLQDWIANARRLDEILAEMQQLSLSITERLLPAKPKRQRRATAKPPVG